MFYTVYRTTNKINGKFYIGTHKTTDPDDNYLGSGKILKRAIEKHGVENFVKEVLHVFDNPEEMFAKEREIVTVDFLEESNTYNLKIGGEGGFDFLNSSKFNNPTHSAERAKRMGLIHSERMKNDPGYAKERSAAYSERMKKMHSEGKIKYNTFTGKAHTPEAKKRIALGGVNRVGERNGQFGTFWVTVGVRNMKMSAGAEIPDGFSRGRSKKQISLFV